MRSSGVGELSSDVFTWSETRLGFHWILTRWNYSIFKRHAFLKFSLAVMARSWNARLDASVASVRGTSDDSQVSESSQDHQKRRGCIKHFLFQVNKKILKARQLWLDHVNTHRLRHTRNLPPEQ
jgi:hypothetical protein